MIFYLKADLHFHTFFNGKNNRFKKKLCLQNIKKAKICDKTHSINISRKCKKAKFNKFIINSRNKMCFKIYRRFEYIYKFSSISIFFYHFRNIWVKTFVEKKLIYYSQLIFIYIIFVNV